jgi:hypothetical protein
MRSVNFFSPWRSHNDGGNRGCVGIPSLHCPAAARIDELKAELALRGEI